MAEKIGADTSYILSLIHISEPTRRRGILRKNNAAKDFVWEFFCGG